MSCEEFDGLFALAEGCCQICGIDGPSSTHGILILDHDNTISYLAVRGLLCSPCNTNLPYVGRLNEDAVARYLANAWHLTHRNAQPVVVHVPDLPLAEVPDLLQAAVAWCADERGRPLRSPAARRPLVSAVRIAAKAGMRQRDIVKAVGHFWTREQVYFALHENGRKVV